MRRDTVLMYLSVNPPGGDGQEVRSWDPRPLVGGGLGVRWFLRKGRKVTGDGKTGDAANDSDCVCVEGERAKIGGGHRLLKVD